MKYLQDRRRTDARNGKSCTNGWRKYLKVSRRIAAAAAVVSPEDHPER
jgi:hypothetical protein